MNVASLELCKELYELSGWGLMSNATSTEYYYQKRYVPDDGFVWRVDAWCDIADWGAMLNLKVEKGKAVPAYELGYLLRKLPPHFNTGDVRGAFEFFLKTTGREWFAGYNKPELGKWLYDNNHGVWEHPCIGDTPEDTAAKLAIELFRRGILTREGEKENE